MRSVTIQLRFLTPCLGNIRMADYDRFERDKSGCVVFMNSWWQKVLEYGANGYGKYQEDIGDVRIHPRVEGTVHRYRRYYRPCVYKEHEAFLAGDVVTIKAMLPDTIPPEEFNKLLSLAGEFEGISPYGWQLGLGRFEVVKAGEKSERKDPPFWKRA